MTTTIGPYCTGEKPLPLVVTFTDATDTAINLTGYTAAAYLKPPTGTIVTDTATVTGAAAGQVTYTWGETASPFDQAGRWELEVWVGNNNDRRFASELYVMSVRAALTIPSI
jgi:hypothetical protein